MEKIIQNFAFFLDYIPPPFGNPPRGASCVRHRLSFVSWLVWSTTNQPANHQPSLSFLFFARKYPEILHFPPTAIHPPLQSHFPESQEQQPPPPHFPHPFNLGLLFHPVCPHLLVASVTTASTDTSCPRIELAPHPIFSLSYLQQAKDRCPSFVLLPKGKRAAKSAKQANGKTVPNSIFPYRTEINFFSHYFAVKMARGKGHWRECSTIHWNILATLPINIYSAATAILSPQTNIYNNLCDFAPLMISIH